MFSTMLLAMTMMAPSGPIKVEAVRAGEGWQLRRGGSPYFIKGVGGTQEMERLAQLGGNSVRTWGVENAGPELDQAHRYGLTVTLGIWLGHRSYFDYTNEKQLEEQRAKVREAVIAHRNHPALLMWGLGNEMEVDNNDTPALWKEIDVLARMVKELDPNRPTMSVVAEVSREKIERIKKYAPNLDVLGVNSYGGLNSLATRLKEFGWTKPWVVTEFGPLGPWERPKAPWGAPLEQTSSEKANFYLESYRKAIDPAAGCLGSYVFLWGEKQEVTPTWFGMFLTTGETLPTVDAMAYVWNGKWPTQRAPELKALNFEAASKEVKVRAPLTATIDVTDPNGDPLEVRWVLRRETGEYRYAGEGERRPEVVDANLPRGRTLKFEAPAVPGNYRLYVYVRDGKGAAATANAPFAVR